jgi:serine protease inhibitor
MKLKLPVILFILIMVVSCKKEASEVNPKPVVEFTATQSKVLQSSNQFGINLFDNLAANQSQTRNLFISPLSVYLALTMTYNGASGQTATEMKTALGFDGLTDEEINESCKELVDIILNIDPKVILKIANSIWYRNNFEVETNFLNTNQHYFDATVHASNFNDPATVGLINDWVKSKTNQKIDKVVSYIDPNTVMYLINAIYFKGAWKYKFETNNTFSGNFTCGNSMIVSTKYMNQKVSLKHMSNDIFSAVELPYGNSGFSMMILLPNAGKKTGDIIQNFTSTNWNQWCNSMDSSEVLLKIPKFKFTYDSVINESLKTLGMPRAFDPTAAEFAKINPHAQLFISKVLHKSFVEVNEEGTEAAAVTSVEIGVTANLPGVIFSADRPFIFAIKENTTQTILFSGLVNNPNLQ